MTWKHKQTYTAASQSWPSYLAVAGLWRKCHCNWREGRGHDPERTHSRMLLVSGLLSLPFICLLQREMISLYYFSCAQLLFCKLPIRLSCHLKSLTYVLNSNFEYWRKTKCSVYWLHCIFFSTNCSHVTVSFWEQLSSFIYLLVFTWFTLLPSLHLTLSMSLTLLFLEWIAPGGLDGGTTGQSITCVCVGLCVNEIKWEWMCGPPRGLAAGAVYNHQATSLLLSCPLTYSFLPLPLLNDFFCVIADKKHC